MASVTLTRSWVHLADDPSTFVTAYSVMQSDSRQTSGDVRMYANGRRRLITSTGRAKTVGITFRYVDDDTMDTLDSWAGLLLMFRDHRGRLMFGSYFVADVADLKGSANHDVTVSFTDVTHSIEV